MLTKDDILGLEVGDVLEVDSLLVGLDPNEPLKLRVTVNDVPTLTVIFLMTWYGVTLGTLTGEYKGPKTKWTVK